MGASSVTGVSGPGVSGKVTTNELSRLSNGPSILIAGLVTVSSSGSPTSPPSSSNSVIFPIPFAGTSDDYCVILTAVNGSSVYISSLNDDDLDGDSVDDHFVGFTVTAGNNCDVMYMVTKRGIRAS